MANWWNKNGKITLPQVGETASSQNVQMPKMKVEYYKFG